MARYGNVVSGQDYSDYGTSQYGPDDIPDYSLKFVRLEPTDGDRIYFDDSGVPVFSRLTLSWAFNADDTYPIIKILRSSRGFPVGNGDPSATTIFDNSSTAAINASLCTVVAPTVTRPYFYVTDTFVIPGRDYYYTILVVDAGTYDVGDLIDRWSTLAEIKGTCPGDHKSIDRLFGALPPAFTSTYAAPDYEVTGARDGVLSPSSTAYLPMFLAGLAWVWDQVYTDADRLRNLWDPTRCPSEVLPALANTVGIPLEPALGDARLRPMVQYVNEINGKKTTQTGIRALAESLSGFESLVTRGDNLFLDIDQASFTSGTGSWGPALIRQTTNPVASDSSMDHVPNVLFNLDDEDAVPACANWVRTNSAQTVASASGVTNTELSWSENPPRLTVTTEKNHGLRKGDYITLSGGTGYDGTYPVIEIPNSTQYQVVSITSASLTPVGRTVAPSTSYPNPFAISQGIALGTIPTGGTYSLSFNVHSTSSSGLNGLTVTLDWHDAQGWLVGTTSGIDPIGSSPSTSAWIRAASSAITPPSTRAKFVIVKLVSASGSGTHTLYLDKFQFRLIGADTPTVYQEPRTITTVVTAPLDGGITDPIVRSVFLSRIKSRTQENTALGTPSRVFLAPVILTKSDGLPTNIVHGTAVDITFYGISDAAPLTWSCTIPGLTSGTNYTFVTATDAETGEKYGHLTSSGIAAGTYYPEVTVTDNNGISTTKRFYLKIL